MTIRRIVRAICAVILCLPGVPEAGSSQIYDLSQLNTEQIAGLDLARTVVLIPGGILEQHGPYLPSYTDGFVNEFLTERIAQAIVAKPGWSVLLFPPIPLGAGGANQVGFKHIFPGTYHVHFTALRSVFMDVAAELGEAGFQWIFIISSHGAVSHKRALDDASDFFNDMYPGTMVHLTGVLPLTSRRVDVGLSEEQQVENGLDVHGGMDETSRILFLRPDLVAPGYVAARPHAGRSWADLVAIGRRENWPGYFGSPRLASAARGAVLLNHRANELIEIALAVLDGMDPRALQRQLAGGTFSAVDPGRAQYAAESDRHEAAIEAKKNAWLAARTSRR